MKKLKNSELNRISVSEFKNTSKSPMIIILDNIRSAHNVGSIFRTCDAFLINEIILCGELPIVDYGFKKFSVSALYDNIIDEILFNNNDELFNLIDEYKDIKKREKIKVEINNIFDQYYCPQIHGEYIQSRI